MRMLINQIRQVVRRLGRAPMFTAITLLTLAIGVGANTVIFSVVNGVLLKALPYPQADRLIGVWYAGPGVGIADLNIAPSNYFILREQSTTLEDIGCYDGDAFNVTGSGQPEHVEGLDVTDGTLPLLGVTPALGRIFTRQDDAPGAPATVLITYGYWQKKFGGATSVIGQSITMDGTARQIVGVLPQGFNFLDFKDVALVVPFGWDRSKTHLGNFSHSGIARLKPGVTIQQASADVARLIPVTERSFPVPDGFNIEIFDKARLQPNLRPLKQDVIGDIGKVLWILMGSIAMVLLVACANVANLLLVRVEGRRQELAIRSALGAPWKRIAGELLTESLVLGVAGSAIGLALAFGALRALVAVAPAGLPRLDEIGINVPVLLFALGLALFTSLLIGAIPIFKYAGVKATSGLREGGRALSQSRERHRARKTLVIVQVALALVLLICSGLMIRTFRALMHVDPGFSAADQLQTFHFWLPGQAFPNTKDEDLGPKVLHMQQAIRDKLAAMPGVQSVSFSANVPMDGSQNNDVLYAEDHVAEEHQLPHVRRFYHVSPGFFSTMGTRFLAGRDLTWSDMYDHLPVALISENFAREYWGSAQNALGKRIRVTTKDDWRSIIGVVQDVHVDGVDKPAPTMVFWPTYRTNFEGDKFDVDMGVKFVVRSPRAGSQAFMNDIQQQVWSVNSTMPLSSIRTEGELYKKSMARTSFMLVMLCVAGSMALLLGVIGIYGVISYTVSQRTREIGIRMALGAQRSQLTSLFVRQGLWLTLIGSACGLVVAFVTMRLMASVLFDVSPVDPLTYIVITIGVGATTCLACYIPSRRAATVNPVTALRSE